MDEFSIFFIAFILYVGTIVLIDAYKKVKAFKDGGPVPGVPLLPRMGKTIKYNIRLSIKSIIRTEQILSKPFTDIDYTNIEELTKLLYCTVLSNNPVSITFEEFQLIAENEKQFTTMIKEIEKVNKVLEQFSQSNKSGSGEGPGEPQYIKDLVGMLIMSGLDAHYVMNEMEISDIPVFVEAYEKKKREEMEASRLWTFMSIIPHVDTKKVKSPKDLMMFPWEEEDAQKAAEEALLRDKDAAEKFFSGEFNPLNNN